MSVPYFTVVGLGCWLMYVVITRAASVLRYWTRYRRICTALKQFGGPTPHWLYGNLHQFPGFTEEGIEWLGGIVEENKKAAVVWVGPLGGVLSVFHPDTVKPVLSSTSPKPTEGLMHFYRFAIPWIGRGLITNNGDHWFRNRRLITPGFHFGVLKSYLSIFNKSADNLIEMWKAKGEGSIDITESVSGCTLETILKCAMSYEGNIQQEIARGRNKYISAVNSLSTMMLERILHPYLVLDWLYYATPTGRKYKQLCDLVHQVADDVIKKRKLALKSNISTDSESNNRYKDFVDILLEATDETGNGLSDDEIRQEVDTFLFAGHDTTASALTWALYRLSINPDIQEKCRQEVEATLDGRDDIVWEDLPNLEYLMCCVKESIRLSTTVPVINRVLDKDMELDGKLVLAGTVVEINIMALHNNPHVWGHDVREFKPERFLPENRQDMDPFAFVPFSAGPRNCIGQNFATNEIKVVLGKILHRFTFELDATCEVERKPQIVMKSQNGIRIKFTER